MELTPKISRNNFYSFLWHATFFALSRPFMDVDTIIPAMLVDAGGSAIQIGIMTAIMVGGSSFTQLFFAPFISNYHYKRNFLLLGINARILALLGMGLMLIYSPHLSHPMIIWLIFILISLFSFSGAFANVSYTDILGKSVLSESRKSFFSIRQVINGIVLFLAAMAAKKILSLWGYPDNYGYLFLIAFASLFIASLGFWNIKEVIPSRLSVQSPGHFIKLIREEWRQNPQLKYFLGFINTMGISISFLPFIILFGKQMYHTQSSDTGWMLLIKIIGTVATGFLLFFLSGRYKYRYLLYGGALLTFISPLILLLPFPIPSLAIVFFFGGIIYTAYNISMNGVLLEISGNTNRALYTGIAGAGNILPAIFPLAGGWIIKHFGFLPFFSLFMIVIFASLFFIYRMDFKH